MSPIIIYAIGIISDLQNQHLFIVRVVFLTISVSSIDHYFVTLKNLAQFCWQYLVTAANELYLGVLKKPVKECTSSALQNSITVICVSCRIGWK